MISIGHKLYVFGGCDCFHGRVSDLHEYDTETNTWTALPSSPLISGRGGPSIVGSKDGQRIYIATGYSGQENCDAYVYHITTQTWEVITTNDDRSYRARSVCASCLLGDLFIVLGGEVSTVYRLDHNIVCVVAIILSKKYIYTVFV